MPRKYPPNKGGRPIKHGARQLARLLRANALDRRTQTARMLEQLKADLIEDAGGLAHVTNRERVLIERTAALILLCGSIENYVFGQAEFPDKDGKLPAVLSQHYVSFVNTTRLNLLALGLKPDRPARDASLQEYIQQQTQKPSQEPQE